MPPEISNDGFIGGFMYLLHDPKNHVWHHEDGFATFDVWKAKQFLSQISAANHAIDYGLDKQGWEIRKVDIELKDIIEIVSEDEVMLESYYVTIRTANNDSRRTERVTARDFKEAQDKAWATCNLTNDERIISIEVDYKV